MIGQKQIHQKIQQLNFRDCHAKITQVLFFKLFRLDCWVDWKDYVILLLFVVTLGGFPVDFRRWGSRPGHWGIVQCWSTHETFYANFRSGFAKSQEVLRA